MLILNLHFVKAEGNFLPSESVEYKIRWYRMIMPLVYSFILPIFK